LLPPPVSPSFYAGWPLSHDYVFRSISRSTSRTRGTATSFSCPTPLFSQHSRLQRLTLCFLLFRYRLNEMVAELLNFRRCVLCIHLDSNSGPKCRYLNTIGSGTSRQDQRERKTIWRSNATNSKLGY
jgi:hypothetical protein